MGTRLSREPSGRGLERADLVAHRHGRRAPDGAGQGRFAAYLATTRRAVARTPAPDRAGAGHRVARRTVVSGLHPRARSITAKTRRDDDVVHDGVARRRLRGLQRIAAGPVDAFG